VILWRVLQERNTLVTDKRAVSPATLRPPILARWNPRASVPRRWLGCQLFSRASTVPPWPGFSCWARSWKGGSIYVFPVSGPSPHRQRRRRPGGVRPAPEPRCAWP